jgi:hypothetical protein
LFKYYNNILGTGNRVWHIDNTRDPACIFCIKRGYLPAPIESFSHLFFDCPCVEPILIAFTRKFFRTEVTREKYFTGNFDNLEYKNTPLVLILDILRYTIWQMKLYKVNISYYTVEEETLGTLDQIISARKKFKNMIINSDLLQVDGPADGGHGNGQRP